MDFYSVCGYGLVCGPVAVWFNYNPCGLPRTPPTTLRLPDGVCGPVPCALVAPPHGTVPYRPFRRSGADLVCRGAGYHSQHHSALPRWTTIGTGHLYGLDTAFTVAGQRHTTTGLFLNDLHARYLRYTSVGRDGHHGARTPDGRARTFYAVYCTVWTGRFASPTAGSNTTH